MAASTAEPRLLEALIAGSQHRAETAMGRWLRPDAIRRNLEEHFQRLLAGSGRRPRGEPRLEQAEMVHVGPWVAIAQPLPTAESLPFPHVVLWALASEEDPQAWPTPGVLHALAAEASERFLALETRGTAIFLHGPVERVVETLGDALRPYKRWLAAPMSDMVAARPPAQSERVAVTAPSDLSFWPDYARMYDEFWASDPHLRHRIGMERPEDLAQYLAAGGLRLIWIDGDLAGVIGGVRLVELGLRGWRLRERVLGGRWRGSGFGSAALDAAIRALPFEPDDLLWGTILPENIGSMGSARRLGRVDVGGLWWLTSRHPAPSA